MKLRQLSFVIDHDLSIDLILSNFSLSYWQFVLNHDMNNLISTILELINALKTIEFQNFCFQKVF